VLVAVLREATAFTPRRLARHAGSTTVTIIVFALGIGVNTSIFSIVYGLILRPLPVRSPQELRYVYADFLDRPQPLSGVTYREYTYLRDTAGIFREVLARQSDRATWVLQDAAVPLTGEMVTANYFDVLGVPMALGRSLRAGDEAPGAEPVVVISDHLWATRFDKDPSALGSFIRLDTNVTDVGGHVPSELLAYRVIGVTPIGFNGTISAWEAADFWLPVVQRAADYELSIASDFLGRTTSLTMIGRLTAGVDDAGARTVLQASHASWRSAVYPGSRERWTLVVRREAASRLPLDAVRTLDPRSLGAAALLVAAAVLLIAATNVAGLQMARTIAAGAERGVRIALGAGRWHLALLPLAEASVTALIGAALSVPLTWSMVGGFLVTAPRFLGHLSGAAGLRFAVSFDGTVLGYGLIISLAVGLLSGVAPAWVAARADWADSLTLRRPGRISSTRLGLRGWLIIPQLGLTVALLLLAAGYSRFLIRLASTGHGYDSRDVVVAELRLPIWGTAARPGSPASKKAITDLAARRRAFERSLIQRLESNAAIISATLGNSLPWDNRMRVSVVPRIAAGGTLASPRWVYRVDATPGYFRTFGIHSTRGRLFTPADLGSRHPVVVVSDSLARLLWPGRNPLGEQLALRDLVEGVQPRWREVVGVVGTVRRAGANDSGDLTVYLPHDFAKMRSSFVAVRTRPGAGDVTGMLAREAAMADAAAGLRVVRTADDTIAQLFYPRRLASVTLGIAGLAGLLIASVGLYGLVSTSVAGRRREFGIRRALGAGGCRILALALREATGILIVGCLLGFAITVFGARTASLLGLRGHYPDAASVAVVTVLIACVAIVAALVPALRATRIGPVLLLRED
jgi:predicted permease